ncbi:AsmA family protein [Rhodopseudomonas palustris]|uniref:AsmA family protein n=1 Tax=Rhodopseudomonas palustris TaxID=1076 RepID=UPI000E5A50AE|nr:AsmA family protein [Rhodopseudomonas palustris]QLH73615.1 AsmA family protein [Rhodopseudomonas palustris]RHZ91304.1 AsmA family protein [Rhodopseudomonas palustris]
MKPIRIAGAIAALLLVAATLLIAIGIPAGALTGAIQSRIERDTGYRVTIAGTGTVRLFPAVALTLHDVSAELPGGRTTDPRLKIATVRAELPLTSLISATPRLTELTLISPELHLPLLRQRDEAGATPARKGSAELADIERIVVQDGVVVMTSTADNIERRIAGIQADIEREDADGPITASGSATLGRSPLSFELTTTPPADDKQPMLVDLTLDAPGLLTSRLSAKAEARLRGTTFAVNGISGKLGDAPFNGWASVDVTGKPVVKLDLDFQRLDLIAITRTAPPGSPWSETPLDLAGLNYVDADVRLSATELHIGAARIAPASADAKLSGGVLSVQASRLAAYGGQATGKLAIDASGAVPAFDLQGDLSDVHALPLLDGLADFERLDGRLQAKLALRSSGGSARAIASNLNGSAAVGLRDGAIHGIDVVRMIRNLTAHTQDGWQIAPTDATDLSEFAASFRIAQGKAETSDLKLAGPLVRMTGAGAIDLPTKTLALKVEPKLVLTTQGQSALERSVAPAPEPIGFGIPVRIEGPWIAPRIFPDIAGVLDDPDKAYQRLREVGSGLFGLLGSSRDDRNNSGGSDRSDGDSGAAVNAIIKQLFGR